MEKILARVMNITSRIKIDENNVNIDTEEPIEDPKDAADPDNIDE
ncbi:hypothetical protein [Bacillus sp. AFS073361]|nr:hypothetical protein [Bacillus sp. AFS073361]